MERNSVSFMKEYLKYVVEFEKYVYIWRGSADMVNEKIEETDSRCRKLEKARTSVKISLKKMNESCLKQQECNSGKIAIYRKNRRVSMLVLLADVLICIIIGIIFGLYANKDILSFANIDNSVLLSLFAALSAFVFTGVGPVCIGVCVSNTRKLKKTPDPEKIERFRSRREIVLKQRKNRYSYELKKQEAKKATLSEMQRRILNSLRSARNSLAEIYSANILPSEYRRLNPAATMLWYLESGKCSSVEGCGGIYETYENELKLGKIVKKYSDVREFEQKVELNQPLFYGALREMNEILSRVDIYLNEETNLSDENEENGVLTEIMRRQIAEYNRSKNLCENKTADCL